MRRPTRAGGSCAAAQAIPSDHPLDVGGGASTDANTSNTITSSLKRIGGTSLRLALPRESDSHTVRYTSLLWGLRAGASKCSLRHLGQDCRVAGCSPLEAE